MKNYKSIGLVVAALVLIGVGAIYSKKADAPVVSEEQGTEATSTSPATNAAQAPVQKVDSYKKPVVKTSASASSGSTIRTVMTNTSFFPTQGLDYSMIENQSVKIPGAELTLKVNFVQDMTSAGCIGDSLACPDKVDISVSQGFNTQFATLYSPFMDGVKEAGKNSITLFGYKFRLDNLKQKGVIIHVDQVK